MGMESRIILVVDDNYDIRVALSDILEDEGYGVMQAENGIEALDKLRSGLPRPCVILLDLMMPKMDGAAFRGIQSKDPAIADIPVVLVSANLSGGQTAIPLNVAGVLPKPFAATDLLNMVARLC